MRRNLRLWGYFARRPALYRLATRAAAMDAGAARPQARPLPHAAVGGRLDRRARSPGARGRHLLRPLCARATGRTHLMSSGGNPDCHPPRLAARASARRPGGDVARADRVASAASDPSPIPAAACRAGRPVRRNVEKEFGRSCACRTWMPCPARWRITSRRRTCRVDMVMAPHPGAARIPWSPAHCWTSAKDARRLRHGERAARLRRHR